MRRVSPAANRMETSHGRELDAHKDSISVAVCEAGREPSRFVGTLGPDVQGVLKTLRKYGPARHVSVVYEGAVLAVCTRATMNSDVVSVAITHAATVVCIV